MKIELTRVRTMAEHADDGFLLYLLDMAILEANRRARSIAESRARATDEAQFSDGNGAPPQGDGELEVVR
jgi:hypothetical protein